MDTVLARAPSPSDIPKNENSGLDKQKLIRTVKNMYDKRNDWEHRWKEIQKYQLPYMGNFENDTHKRRDKDIVDGVAWSAAQKFAAGIMSGLTPPSRQWFKLGFKDIDTEGNVEIQQILDDRQAKIEAVMHGSNFYNAIHSVYLELPFGQCPMPIFYDPQNGIRCTPLTIGTYALEVDGYGKVCKLARKVDMTLEQIVSSFGLDSIPGNLKNQAIEKKWDNKKHKVFWLVEKNDNFRPGYMTKNNMPWRSVYWMDGSASNEFLYVGGFEENAIPVARYLVTDTLDPYAKGPGWFAEGDSKQLQVMKRDYLSAVELAIKPPMGGPASLMNNGGINLIPGGFTPVEDTAGGAVKPLFEVRLDLDHTAQEIQRIEDKIKDHYNVNLFVMLEQLDTGRMTATEINARNNEKLQQLGPVVERLEYEFLTAIIERIYGILDRAGAFPPIDPELEMALSGEEIKIEYISPLAQAQKMSGLVNIEQGLAQVGQMAQLWPDVLKVVNPDGTVRKYLETLGVPAEMMNSIEAVEAMKKAEQQAAAQQQAMEQGMAMAQAAAPAAQAAKNLTEAANDANPALQQWLGVGVN